MATPIVQTTSKGTDVSNVTTRALTLPAGITVGDGLIVIISCDGTPTIGIDTGASGVNWTLLRQDSDTGNNVTGAVLYKESAEGSDAL